MTTAEKAYETWWLEQSRRGDPAHNPNLVREAFAAGFVAGRDQMVKAGIMMAELAETQDETDDGRDAAQRIANAFRELQ